MQEAKPNIRKIWGDGQHYYSNRIPGILVTSKSTVIIYNEARHDHSDWAMMDIFMQRSKDQGKTFGEMIYLARGSVACPTVNNPVMMEDHNGRLHFLYCGDYTINGNGAWYRFSDDDGLTWSEPENITDATEPEIHDVFAFGPGHGICTADGMLLIPVWMVPKSAGEDIHSHSPSVISTFYSKDRGKSWHLGEIIPAFKDVQSPNETVAAETSDGRILLNIRSFALYRSKAYSNTGIDGWSTPTNDTALPDPKCFGSIVSYRNFLGKFALLQVNCASQTERNNVTLTVSFDDGKTWDIKHIIDAERGGYCDVAADEKNEKIYILYEEDYGKNVFLATFTPSCLQFSTPN